MHKIPVGVLGASGYAGRELCGLIRRHPRLSLAFAGAQGQRGQRARVAPGVGGEIAFIGNDEAALDRAAVVFSALPHGASAEYVERARSAGARVVDLSADLRPGNGGCTPAAYGLTEWQRESVKHADVVANPGCYPTAALLALLPLLERGLVAPGATIVVDAASGVTGAGMSPKPELLFGEITESYKAYGVGNEHRHLAEMRATVAALGADADVLFTPHLLPVARGILATITVPLAAPLADPLAPWRDRYEGEPFIELADTQPTLRDVAHRNVVRIAVTPAAGLRTPTLVVTSAIDNLVKGAAGQALQNANVLLGLEETMGLPL